MTSAPRTIAETLRRQRTLGEKTLLICDDDRLGYAAAATDSGTPFGESAIIRALHTELSAYKIPRRFITLRHSELPVLSSGKLDISGLRRLFDG